MPAISVILPVYQAEATLNQAAESVLRQTFTDWELLLVDDGSKDGSPALCDKLAAQDSRVRVFHKTNAGVSAARNLGIQEAKGAWIAFLDADDSLEDNALEELLKLQSRTGADIVSCAHWNLHPDGSKSPEVSLPAGTMDAAAIRKAVVEPLLGDRLRAGCLNGFIWHYLFSSDILRRHSICFDGPYLEDELFLMEYCCNAKKLAATDTPLYNYYLNPNSVTHRYMADFPAVFQSFLRRKEALAQKHGLDMPQWRENTIWAGILIGIGNEYAKGSPLSIRERRQAVEALCAQPDMANAIRSLNPEGMGRNKQMVATLVRGRHFHLLTLLYRLKNRL